MEPRTKVYALAAGTVVYAVGYVVLLVAALRGELDGAVGFAAVLMATGLLVALLVGVALAKTEAELLEEL